MADAPRDANRNTVIQGVDHVSFATPTNPAVNTSTHALLVDTTGTSQKDTFAAAASFTITFTSLTNSTAGVGRQSTLVTANTAKSALIQVTFTTGTSPTANSLIYVYLIRGNGTINDDNAGASDAGLTVINSPLLGTILCSAATTNAVYYGLFDTKFLGSLGPTFGIAIVNSTGATSLSSGCTATYTLIT